MTIEFRKVPKEGFNFSVETDSITFSGFAVNDQGSLLKCSGLLEGKLLHSCDRCGTPLEIELNEKVDVWASNGLVTGIDDDLLNIVEFTDEKVDFDMILESEMEALKSDYFYCQECQKLEGE